MAKQYSGGPDADLEDRPFTRWVQHVADAARNTTARGAYDLGFVGNSSLKVAGFAGGAAAAFAAVNTLAAIAIPAASVGVLAHIGLHVAQAAALYTGARVGVTPVLTTGRFVAGVVDETAHAARNVASNAGDAVLRAGDAVVRAAQRLKSHGPR